MNAIVILLNSIELIVFLVSVLFSIAYLTVAERKTLGYMQRRIGPNAVGYYGLLQAFADAVKLLIKEITINNEANKFVFVLSPIITLVTALLGWLVVPFGPALSAFDIHYAILYSLAVGSLGVLGSLLAGWGSNSKYSFMGSIRSTAVLISYELVLTTVYIVIVMFNSDLSYYALIENQRVIWNFVPLFPIMIVFYISSVAETNRPPFDFIEAENELVAGFFTEYSGSPFVLFFLAEYGNLLLMSAASTMLFFGGYLFIFPFQMLYCADYSIIHFVLESISFGISFGIKVCVFCYIFIWVRASFPRFTFDNLIDLCWIRFLPILFGTFIFVPSMLMLFNALSI